MKKNVIVASGIAAGLALLVACGDEVTEVTNVTEKASLDQVKKFKELPKCEEDIEGSLMYVKDSAKVFVCTGDGWESFDGAVGEKGEKGDKGAAGDKGTSCTAKQTKDKTGFDIVCGDKTVGTIKNGENGEDGKKGAQGDKGEDGENGTSCTAKQTKDKTGFDLVCGGKTVGTIKNGENGKDGDDCSLTEIENGQVVVKCGEESATLFKASCGVGSYDPATQFCANDMKVYPLCHNTLAGLEPYLNPDGTYNVQGYFCDASDLLVSLCVSVAYDYTTQFCSRSTVLNRCNSVAEGLAEDLLNDDGSYNGMDYFCSEKGVLYEKCNGSPYDPDLQFCDRTTNPESPQVVTKCGEQTYVLETHMCVDGQVEEAIACCIPKGQNNKWCDGHPNSLYDVRKQFCDTRDGRPYDFKTITKTNGNGEVVYSETWMTENLKYTKTQEGEYMTRPDDDKCSTYGCYYTWLAANSYCPEGWDLPDNADYRALMDAFGAKPTAYRLNGTNISGFSVIDLGGYYFGATGQSSSSANTLSSYFWSKTERVLDSGEEPTSANRFFVGAKNTVQYTGSSDKIDYLSVRCIKRNAE